MSPKKNQTAEPEKFEDLLQQLELAVAALEREELPLDEAIQQYKTAMELVKVCQTRLDEAEKTVTQLIQNADGTFREEPLPDRDNTGEQPNE